MYQDQLFNIADVQTTVGITGMHNIKVDVKIYAKYGQPEKTLKAAAEKLATLVASGEIETSQADSCLQECFDRISHLIGKELDLTKILKTAFSTIKRSLKAKKEAAKRAIVKMCKKVAIEGGSYTRCKMKEIAQGLLFGQPTQRLTTYGDEEHIIGCWFVEKRKFSILERVAVEV